MARRCGIFLIAAVGIAPAALAQGIELVEPNPFLAGQPVSAGLVLAAPGSIQEIRLNGAPVGFEQVNNRTALFGGPAVTGAVATLEVDLTNGTTIDHEVPIVITPVPFDVLLNRKADFVHAITSPPGPAEPGFLRAGVGTSVEAGLRQAADAYAAQDLGLGMNRTDAVRHEIAALSGLQIQESVAQFILDQLQEDPCTAELGGPALKLASNNNQVLVAAATKSTAAAGVNGNAITCTQTVGWEFYDANGRRRDRGFQHVGSHTADGQWHDIMQVLSIPGAASGGTVHVTVISRCRSGGRVICIAAHDDWLSLPVGAGSGGPVVTAQVKAIMAPLPDGQILFGAAVRCGPGGPDSCGLTVSVTFPDGSTGGFVDTVDCTGEWEAVTGTGPPGGGAASAQVTATLTCEGQPLLLDTAP